MGRNFYPKLTGGDPLENLLLFEKYYATSDPPESPDPQEEAAPPEDPGFFSNVAGDIAGGLVDYVEMTGRAGRALPGGEKAGVGQQGVTGKVVEWAKQFKTENPWLDNRDEEGISRWFHEGLRSFVTSVAAGLPGAAAGAAAGTLGGPLAPVTVPVGALVGYATSGATMFGLAEYDATMEDALQKGVSRDEAEQAAVLSGVAEGGFEFLGDILQGLTLGTGRIVTQPGKAALKKGVKELFKLNTKQAIKRGVGGMGFETGSELATAAVQTEAQKSIGLTDQTAFEGAVHAFGPALVASAMFGGLGEAGLHFNRQRIRSAIADPKIDQKERFQAVGFVYNTLKKDHPEVAKAWAKSASTAVARGEAISLDAPLEAQGEVRSDQGGTTPGAIHDQSGTTPGVLPENSRTPQDVFSTLTEESENIRLKGVDRQTHRRVPLSEQDQTRLTDIERTIEHLRQNMNPLVDFNASRVTPVSPFMNMAEDQGQTLMPVGRGIQTDFQEDNFQGMGSMQMPGMEFNPEDWIMTLQGTPSPAMQGAGTSVPEMGAGEVATDGLGLNATFPEVAPPLATQGTTPPAVQDLQSDLPGAETAQGAIGETAVPEHTPESLNALTGVKVRKIAKDFGVENVAKKNKGDLVESILGLQALQEGQEENAALPPAEAEKSSPVAAEEEETAKPAMTYAETKHTKEGHDLFVVSLDDRVSRAEYTRIHSEAKKRGGYYSKFKKGGAIPGFQFKDKDKAREFMQAFGKGQKQEQAKTEAATEREPWQMTRDVYIESVSQGGVVDDRANQRHKNIVTMALNEGKPVPDFVLRDYPDLQAEPKEAVAQAQKANDEKLRKQRNEIQPEDDLLTAVSKLGGIDKTQVKAEWGDTIADLSKDRKRNNPIFGKPVIRNKQGLPLDTMRELLGEHGFMYESINDFLEAFDAATRGEKVLSVQAQPSEAQIEQAEQSYFESLNIDPFDFTDVQVDEIGYNSMNEDERQAYEALYTLAAGKIDQDVLIDLVDGLSAKYEDEADFYREATKALEGVLNEADQGSQKKDGQSFARKPEEGEESRGEVAGDETDRGEEKLVLTSPEKPAAKKSPQEDQSFGFETKHKFGNVPWKDSQRQNALTNPMEDEIRDRQDADKQTDMFAEKPAIKTDIPHDNKQDVNVQEKGEKAPSFDDMVQEALRWQGAHLKAERVFKAKGDTKGQFKVARTSGKDHLDNYLIKRFGIDRSEARDVSNYLTQNDLKADESANLADFKGEEWADNALAAQKPASVSDKEGSGEQVKPQEPKEAELQEKEARLAEVERELSAQAERPNNNQNQDESQFSLSDETADLQTDITRIRARREHLEENFGPLVSDWKNRPPIRFVETEKELPDAIHSDIQKAQVQGKVKGVYHHGTAYLVVENIQNLEDAETVLLHEVLGHYGLDQLFGPELKPILAKMFTKIGGNQGVLRLAEKYGIDIKPYLTPGKTKHLSERNRNALIMNELIAHMAGNKVHQTWLQKIVSAIRNGLRRMGFGSLLKFSDNDLLNVVTKARDAVVKGKSGSVFSVSGAMFSASERGVLANAKKLTQKQAARKLFTKQEREDFANSDILYSLTGSLPRPHGGLGLSPSTHARAKEQTKNAIDYLRMKFQDKFLPLLRVQELLQKQGWQKTNDNDAYRAEELFHGKATKRLETFYEDQVRPLVEAIRESGQNIEDVENYLYAKFAPERNAYIASINPEMEDGGSGMTNAEAKNVLETFAKDGKIQNLERLAQDVQKITAMQREIIRTEGLELDETMDAWELNNLNYVPLKSSQPEAGKGIGTGFNVKRSGTKRALGRTSKADNILAHLFEQVGTTIIRAEKAKVGRAFLTMVEENQDSDLWKIHSKLPMTRAMVNGEVKQVVDRSFPTKDHVLTVTLEDGTVQYVEIFDDDLARVMKNLTPGQYGKTMRALASITRFLSKVSTSLNPEFIITNFERDIQTAMIHLSGEQSNKMARQVLTSIPKAMKGIHNYLRGDKGHEWAEWFDRYQKAGAQVSFMDLRGINEWANKLKALGKDSGRFEPTLNNFRKLGDFIGDYNNIVENAVRLASFRKGVEAGMTESDAASLAKNLTVNFNRKGELGPAMNALYMFANAGVQGSARIFQALLTSKKVQKMMGATMLMAWGLAEMNRLNAGDDDDGENKWDKNVTDYTKQVNLVFMRDNGESVTIRLPYGYNTFVAMGYAMSDLYHHYVVGDGGRDAIETSQFLFSSVMNAFNPFGGDEGLLKMLSPTITDPFVEIATNENFMGRKIYPENIPFGPQKPNSQLYYRTVSEPSKYFAEKLNDLTGGSKWEPGMIDISPEVMDHFSAFVLGGLGRTIGRTADLPAKLMDGDVPIRSIPFLRQMYQEPYENIDLSRFYDNVKQATNMRAAYKEMPQDGRREFLDDHPEIALYKIGNRYSLMLSKLRKQMYQAQDDGNKEMAKKIQKRMNALALKFNKVFNDKTDR